MRILLIGEAPWMQTGYGQPVKQIAEMWRGMGHSTVALAIGTKGPAAFDYGDLPVVMGDDEWWCQDILLDVCNMIRADLVVSLLDPWAIPEPGYNREINGGRPWLAWLPVDQEPAQRGLSEILNYCDGILPFSKFGAGVLRGQMPERYIQYTPLPVDLESFTIADPAGRRKAREAFGIRSGNFVAGLAGANTLCDRKALAQQVEGFCQWAQGFEPEDKPYLLVKSAPYEQGGATLHELVREMDCLQQVMYLSKFARRYGFIAKATLAHYYQAIDVLLHASAAEGFGLQILEAQACGTDVIYAVNSSQPEVVNGCGFAVRDSVREWSNYGGWWHRPSGEGVYQALREWQSNRDKFTPEQLRANAERYSTAEVAKVWQEIFEKVERGEL